MSVVLYVNEDQTPEHFLKDSGLLGIFVNDIMINEIDYPETGDIAADPPFYDGIRTSLHHLELLETFNEVDYARTRHDHNTFDFQIEYVRKDSKTYLRCFNEFEMTDPGRNNLLTNGSEPLEFERQDLVSALIGLLKQVATILEPLSETNLYRPGLIEKIAKLQGI